MRESKEKKPEDFAFDLEQYPEDYIAVRVDHNKEGEKIGVLISHSDSEAEVLSRIDEDRKKHPRSLYHRFGPRDYLDIREGKLIGGDDQ